MIPESRSVRDKILAAAVQLFAKYGYHAATMRDIARGDSRRGEFQRLTIEDGDYPSDGADETRAVEAGPGHRARPS